MTKNKTKQKLWFALDRADTKGGLLSSLFQFVNISRVTPLVLCCNILRQGWRVWSCAIWSTHSDCRIYSSYVNASIKRFMNWEIIQIMVIYNMYVNYSLHCWGIIALQWENAMVRSVLDGQLFHLSVKKSLYIRLFDWVIRLVWKCLMFSHTVIKMPFSSVVMWHLHIHEVTTTVLPFIRLH